MVKVLKKLEFGTIRGEKMLFGLLKCKHMNYKIIRCEPNYKTYLVQCCKCGKQIVLPKAVGETYLIGQEIHCTGGISD